MHVGEISFCDKVAFNIKSEETKRFILDSLEKKYNLRIIHKHFDRYDERTAAVLNQNPHLVCVRSNGNPYFLYLMKYNFIQYCIFIDKKIQQGYYLPRMIVVHMRFDDCMFDDTIMEGEMIKAQDGSWYYLVNDLLVCRGVQLHDTNHPRRINMLYDMLEKHYEYEEYDPFRVGVKTFFRYNEMERLLQEHIPSLPYTCRGLYFKPLFMRFKDILYNFDDNLVKKVERVRYKDVKQFILKSDIAQDSASVKSSSSSSGSGSATPVANAPTSQAACGTRRFYVRKTSTPDVYDLFDGSSRAGIACVPTLKVSKWMREITKDMNMVDRIELPFEYSMKFGKWVPVVG